MNAHVFHPRNEVEDIAAPFALAETIPDVFAYTDPELSGVLALMDRTASAQAISAPLEPIHEIVMIKHFLHGDGRFDGLEVNKRVSGHTAPPVDDFGTHAAQDIEPIPECILLSVEKVGRRGDLPFAATYGA
jgi:hypothetical protein